ncbi:hypothetical protein [Streptomyces sp. NPDC055036]
MATNATPETETPEPRYTIGDRMPDGRYPVTVDDELTGFIHRWHGEWYACTPVEGDVVTPHANKEEAAARLEATAASGVTAAETERTEEAAGIVPWLHPRMKPTRRNIISAAIALARLAELAWTPADQDGKVTGYPGSDNPWPLTCGLDEKVVVRWWSHLRGRNGDNTPRPVWRHEECIPFEDQAAKVAELVGKPAAACPCDTKHPTDRETAAELLEKAERARRADDTEALREHLTRLLGPCPASSARAAVLKELGTGPKKS